MAAQVRVAAQVWGADCKAAAKRIGWRCSRLWGGGEGEGVAAQAGLAAQVGVVWRRTLGIKRLSVRVVRLLGTGYRARAAADAKRRTWHDSRP